MQKNISNSAWAKDWCEFVDSVACIYTPGMGATELTRHYRGATVTWEGEVQKTVLNPDFEPRFVMSMPYHESKLTDDKMLRAQPLILRIPVDQVSAWEKCQVGELISFQARLDFYGFREGDRIVEPTHDDDVGVAPSVKVIEADQASAYNELRVKTINSILLS